MEHLQLAAIPQKMKLRIRPKLARFANQGRGYQDIANLPSGNEQNLFGF